MSRIFKTALLGLWSFTAAAQSDTSWNKFDVFFKNAYRTSWPERVLQVDGSAWGDGTSLGNSLLGSLFLRENITNEKVNRAADQQKAKNLVGAQTEVNIRYYDLSSAVLKQDSLHWFVQYGYRDHLGISYSDDLFRLLGQGNKVFAGDTANGNGLNVKKIRFDYIQFGLIKRFANRSNLSVSVGPARGMRLIDVDGRYLSVFTEQYGTYLDWNVDVNARLSGAYGQQGIQHINGMGAVMSAEFNGMIAGTGAYSVGVENLGFIRYQGKHLSKNAQFRYNGWYIPDFGALSDPDAGQQAYDSIVSVFTPTETNINKSTLLPARVYAGITIQVKANSCVQVEFDKYINTPMMPRFSVSYMRFGKRYYSATRLAFAGYSRLSVHQHVGYNFGRHQVGILLYGLEGWVLPSRATGMGGMLSYGIRL